MNSKIGIVFIHGAGTGFNTTEKQRASNSGRY